MDHRQYNRFWCAAAVWLTAASPAFAGHYVFTDIALPAGDQGRAVAIDDSSQVVGFDDSGQFTYGFTWSGGKTHVFNMPSGPLFRDINAHGICVGLTGGTEGIAYDIATGRTTILPHSAGGSPDPARINVNGVVVGSALDAKGSLRGYLLANHTVTLLNVPGAYSSALTAVNNAGDVAGRYQSIQQGGFGAFLYHADRYTTLPVPGGKGLRVAALDSQRRVAGTYVDMHGVNRGFIVSKGSLQTIDYPGSDSTDGAALGAHGELVGSYTTASAFHGFIYAGGKFTSVSHPNSTATVLVGINAAGTLLGTYIDQADVSRAFIATCPAGQAPCS